MFMRMPAAWLETTAARATGSITLVAPQPLTPTAAAAHTAAIAAAAIPRRAWIPFAPPPCMITDGSAVSTGGLALARLSERELRDPRTHVQSRADDPVLGQGVGDRITLAGRRALGSADVAELEAVRQDLA